MLVTDFSLFIIAFIGLTAAPWVSAAPLCESEDQRFNDVPVVITNRAYKTERSDGNIFKYIDELYNSSSYTDEERNNVVKFHGSSKNWKKMKNSSAEILYDVKHCGKFKWGKFSSTFYGIRIADKGNDADGLTKMKQAISKRLTGKKHLLISMHGFKISPSNHIKKIDTFNEEETPYFAIPVIWKTSRNFIFDVNTNAPKLAKELADLWHILNSKSMQMPMSLMAHSLGNSVLSIFAKDRMDEAYAIIDMSPPNLKDMLWNLMFTTKDKRVFENIFMVAPAISWNIFAKNKNESFKFFKPKKNSPDDDLGCDNQGNAISMLAMNVHVIWHKYDRSGRAYLLYSLYAKLWKSGCNKEKGMMDSGHSAEDGLHPDLKARVHFYEIQNKTTDWKYGHNYEWDNEILNYYRNWI